MSQISASSIQEWDAKHAWHPFTQMEEYLKTDALTIVEAEGCWLYDDKGGRYLDGNASNWCMVHGHRDKELNEALIDQVGRLSQTSYKDLNHPNAAVLSEAVTRIAPEGLTRAFFTDNGSCAIETAIKLSLQYWQLRGREKKRRAIGMKQGYHGDTIGAMSVGNSEFFHGRFREWCFDCDYFSAPYCEEYNGKTVVEDEGRSLEELRGLLEKGADETAFVIMEPVIQGPAGMKFMPREFTKKVADMCKEFGVHLILDEIFVGLGRTGKMLGCDHDGVEPDFICLSKGMTGGYLPFGVTLTSEEVYSAYLGEFSEFKTFFHGHTFAANALTCAVAIKNIEKIERGFSDGSFQRNREAFANTVEYYFKDHPHVHCFRQRGFVCAFQLRDREGKQYEWEKRISHHVSLVARKYGVLLRGVGSDMYFVPPLVMSAEEVKFMCENTSRAILEYLGSI